MRALISWAMPHLIVVPILLPLITAGCMLALGEGRRPLKSAMSTISGLLNLGVVLVLAWWVLENGPVVYLPGNWPAPFGIVLVADQLSVLMVLLSVVIGICALFYSSARWEKAGVHFHPLGQLQVMGLSGAFLTGDLFNLFVFFEILLAASYGLLLHGSGRPRVSAAVHYVAINIAASSLFLVGATTLYGVTGTLTMAHLAQRVLEVPEADRWLLHTGSGVLAVAFLTKAGAWPLNFWLVPAYRSATAPVAAFFALLTKVGVYAILRLSTLLYAGQSETYGRTSLLAFGTITAAFGALGMLGSKRLASITAFSIAVSSGTLLAALSFRSEAVTGGAIFYLVSSTIGISALFLLTDVVERWRNSGSTDPDEAPFLSARFLEVENVNLDDDEERLVGRPIPASIAFLALAFMTFALIIAGLPPLSSFLAKSLMLSEAMALPAVSGALQGQVWLFVAVLLGTGLMSLITLSRAGIRNFWSSVHRDPPMLRLAEGLPVAVLLLVSIALTVAAGPVTRYAQQIARELHDPASYAEAVLSAATVPPPAKKRSDVEVEEVVP
ncbi:MAG TPA: monovalent cation/H+ antiporter subunit D [Myxococcaceae bacterium]|nr:monovalent cation/H+ antiporter subunit D [Myxococcaceae bacterium]